MEDPPATVPDTVFVKVDDGPKDTLVLKKSFVETPPFPIEAAVKRFGTKFEGSPKVGAVEVKFVATPKMI